MIQNYQIGQNGVASVGFLIGMDQNKTTVVLSQPFVNTQDFYTDRTTIKDLFKAFRCDANMIILDHGRYSEETKGLFMRDVKVLLDSSMIDRERYDEILERLGIELAQVQDLCEQECVKYAPFLEDFQKCISCPFLTVEKQEVLTRLAVKKVPIDYSISQFDTLVARMEKHRGNPAGVEYHWMWLFFSEGALEHLINQLPDEEPLKTYKDLLIQLKNGVTCFLQRYEDQLHPIIESSIDLSAPWFQSYYLTYKAMIKGEKSPKKLSYGHVPKVETVTLYLPDRFAK